MKSTVLSVFLFACVAAAQQVNPTTDIRWTAATGCTTAAAPYVPKDALCELLPATMASVTHKFLISYSASSGAFVAAQPAFSDLSGNPTVAQLGSGGASTYVLTDVLGTPTWQAASGGGVSGSGTTGFVPAWTGATALGDSHLDDGVTLAGIVTASEPLLAAGGLNVLNDTPANAALLSAANPGAQLGVIGVGSTALLVIATDTEPPWASTIGFGIGANNGGTPSTSSVGFSAYNYSTGNEYPVSFGAENQVYVQPAASSEWPSANAYVGINNTSPAAQLDVAGAVKSKGRIKGWSIQTASYATVATDEIVQMNASGATTVTLTNSVALVGQVYSVKNVGAGVCTVAAASGDIDTHTSIALSQGQGMEFYWDGTLWHVLSQSLSV